MSRTASESAVTATSWRPRSAMSGSRCTCLPSVRNRESISKSHFVTGLTAALVTDDARWNLRGRNLAIHRARTTEKIRFDSAADVLDVLTDPFGIDIAGLGDRADVEARVNEVLDS
jgi:arylamine N-acetyltransferase